MADVARRFSEHPDKTIPAGTILTATDLTKAPDNKKGKSLTERWDWQIKTFKGDGKDRYDGDMGIHILVGVLITYIWKEFLIV